MSPSSRGFLDAAYQILKETGHPMHGREIVQACLERGLWTTDAVDPNIAGTTTLYSEIRRTPNKRGFAMLGKGQFGLKEWGGTQAVPDRGLAPAPGAAKDPKAALPDLAPRAVSDQPSVLDRTVTFSVAGQRFRMTGREVLERARRVTAHGLPTEASNYVSWVVDIDGQRVGLKWLFGLITGVPHAAFQTNQARPILEDLGLAVHRVEAAVAPAIREAPRREYQEQPLAPSSVSQSPGAILDGQIASIRSFLNGRSGRPSDERLCDWVNFCYEFGLFREGRDLFRLIDPTQVNDWYYERTKRLAKVCAMKVAGQA